MHIVIFDGDPRPRGTALDAALLLYAAEVVAKRHRCERVRLADLTFHECVGCCLLGAVRIPGFPEPGQSRAIEHWLGLFAKRLGARPIGTIVKGGLFGLQTLPARKTREILQCFEELGRQLGASDRLDPKVLRKLCGPDWFPRWLHPVVRLVLSLSDDGSWNRKLKANGAFARRYDQPYGREIAQAHGDSANTESRKETHASL
jgi:hypothetical protein